METFIFQALLCGAVLSCRANFYFPYQWKPAVKNWRWYEDFFERAAEKAEDSFFSMINSICNRGLRGLLLPHITWGTSNSSQTDHWARRKRALWVKAVKPVPLLLRAKHHDPCKWSKLSKWHSIQLDWDERTSSLAFRNLPCHPKWTPVRPVGAQNCLRTLIQISISVSFLDSLAIKYASWA